MLPSLVVKIKYRRTLHQDATPVPCQPQISNFPPVDPMIPCVTPLPCEFQRIHPEKRRVVAVATEGSSLTTRKSSISTFRGATEPSKSGVPAAFLTGTDLHSEIAVTHSKQTTATFLIGARIAHFASRMVQRDAQIGISNPCVLASQNLLLHRRPIQIFLRPTI